MVCPLCGEKQYIKLKKYDTKEIIRCYKDDLHVDVNMYFNQDTMDLHQCINCGLGYFPTGIEGDGDFYKKLSLFPWYYMKEKAEFCIALRHIRRLRPASVLEIGCGKGHFLDHIRDSFAVHATEQNPEAITVLKEKGIPLDQDGNQYDFVVTFQVLEHVKDLRPFLEWAVSKVASDGYLFIAVPNPESQYLSEVMNILDLPPHHINHIYEETLRKLGDLFDLTVEDYFTLPMEPIHLSGLLNQRMKVFDGEQTSQGWKYFFKKLLNRVFARNIQAAIMPLIQENVVLKGHTHGILLHKK